MKKFTPDMDYVRRILLELLAIPSPAGFTDEAVRYTCNELERLGIPFEMTRRGGIRADLKGRIYSPDRSIVAHLDTLGAMVSGLKDNGRLRLTPIGTWSSRFAEGAHATIYTDEGKFEGTILPIKAAGHVYNEEIDELPVTWDNVELRVDHPVYSAGDLSDLGINVGDIISINPGTRMTDTGFICSRYLDDKAGVAVMLGVAREIVERGTHYALLAQDGLYASMWNRQREATEAEERLRKARPDLALSSDFIVGFPGESDADFAATLKLVNEVRYAQAYSFKYSPRPGTPAAVEAEQLSEQVKAERLAGLQQLLGEQSTAFNATCVGRDLPVLLERPGRRPGQLVGRSPYMQAVHVSLPEVALARLNGRLMDVHIEAAHPNSLTGRLVVDGEAVEGATATAHTARTLGITA